MVIRGDKLSQFDSFEEKLINAIKKINYEDSLESKKMKELFLAHQNIMKKTHN
jgi:hypothetical protein